MENFTLPVVCDHRGIILREIACCGGAKQSFACDHHMNAMGECVASPIVKAGFRDIQACSTCKYDTRKQAVSEDTPVTHTTPLKVTPTRPPRVDERTLRGKPPIPADRVKRLERERAELAKRAAKKKEARA